jgi:hypothetical protein
MSVVLSSLLGDLGWRCIHAQGMTQQPVHCVWALQLLMTAACADLGALQLQNSISSIGWLDMFASAAACAAGGI